MKGLVSICALLVALLQLAISVPAFAQTTLNYTPISKPIPEHVIYELYFRKIVFLNDLAQKKDNDGLRGNTFRAVVPRELGINEAQRIVLANIGAQALAQAAALDAQAKAIIERNRSNYAKGILTGVRQVPRIPPELTQLQTSRNNVFLNAKAQLFDQLGAVTFQNIDSRIKAVILPTLRVKPAR